MRIVSMWTITDEDIIRGVREAVEELETDEQITFPDDSSRDELIEECVSAISYMLESYEGDPYTPNYTVIVLDTANIYGYAN